jgi:trehalose synthase
LSLNPVTVGTKSLESYRSIVGDEIIEEIKDLARQLSGIRVLHVNATDFGGGVAELLFTLVPLMKEIGISADWQVINGADNFFTISKMIHNGIQGMQIPWTDEMQDTYFKFSLMNAELIDDDYDFYVIHDPQPLGILNFFEKIHGKRKGKWIWRCHIDTTACYPKIWSFLKPLMELHDANIFTLGEYARDISGPQISIIPPCIDPLSPKNMELSPEIVKEIISSFGVDLSKPIITQVSRFDPWKDPLGVIKVYRSVKRDIPDLQLLLIGSMAKDDPEGWHYYEKTARNAGEDYDIFLLTDLQGVGNLEVNAFQRASDVVIQKSLKEGFGLVASEALWKNKPVVAGNVGGLKLQVVDGENGYLVNSVEECAEKTLSLLSNKEMANKFGEQGHEHVKNNFLSLRNLRDYLRLFASSV